MDMRGKSILKIPVNLLLVTAMIVLALPVFPQRLPVAASSASAAPEDSDVSSGLANEPAPVPLDLTTQDLMAVQPAAPQAPAAPLEPAALQAPTNTIYLRVMSARDEPRALDGAGVAEGDPVTSYKFIINEDNTGDPLQDFGDGPNLCVREENPDYPEGCDWPGIRTVPGWAPIVTQGTDADLSETQGLTLPDGKYLISVLGDGFKMDGEHFTLPIEEEDATIEVRAHPLPLPTSSMVIKVFHDRSLTNGQFDAPVEQGLEGFRASLNDIAGEVTTDLFGNPLCTEYEKDADGNVILDEDGNPANIVKLGQGCYSDADGIINIPNIGAIRWDVLVTPPDGETWIQTTTLEGAHGWDTWLQEAGTGLDNEFLIAAEPFPWTIFGFVAPTDTLQTDVPTGTIKGVIMGAVSYTPFSGGLPYQGQVWSGFAGTKLDRPIDRPWLALNDLQNGDTAIWVGEGNADGSFEITGVPEGDYVLTYWDFKQHYILDFVQLSVKAGEVTDVGVRTMTNWFTEWSGYVFLDYNENGKRDPNEPGVPDYTVVLRDRDNTEIDRMSIASVTDSQGFWELEKGYPMNWWMVLEAYHDLYRPTGYTYQTSNQTETTTILGPGVDVAVMPVLGQWGHLDWGVVPFGPDENGGIAGSVFYDTVRAEDDARYAGAEPWQPGIPDLEVQLYAAEVDAEGNVVTDTTPGPNYGAVVKSHLLATTTTESFVRPKDCQARDADGNPADFPFLAPAEGGYDCIETLGMGTQFGDEYAELPGNWGFSEVYTDPVTGASVPAGMPLPPYKYLVEVVVPDDPILGRPLYKVTREEDVNTFDGDTFVPQIPPPACAGPLHIVDVADVGTDGYELPWDPTATSTPTENPNFAAEGGSRFEGKAMPLCNIRLVELGNGRTIAPTFSFFTDVMIPGRWKGYIIDDMRIETDPNQLFFGEKAGVSYAPIGVYDWTGELEHTVHSDRHGVYEILLPSDQTTNAPTPSGMLSNMYYIYGNDPGQPGAFNDNYNPAFRSIGTSFEIYPGVMVPSDLAPVQNAVNIQAPGSQTSQVPECRLEDTTPQIFRVSEPYGEIGATLVITGVGFGAAPGSIGHVSLENTWLPVESWSDTVIEVTIPTMDAGPHQLLVWSDSGERTRSGLTYHVLGSGYTPPLYEVGPGMAYTTIQSAIDAAAGYADPENPVAPEDALIVVYPGPTQPFTNPLGLWFENLVIYSPVKLQGVGAGGVYSDGTAVRGTVLDGRGYGGDTPYTDWWRNLVADIWANRGGWDGAVVDENGEPRVYEGPVVNVYAEEGEFTGAFETAIDGFAIQGGHQQGQPNNITVIDGQLNLPGEVLVQGGGVFVNAYANSLQITNNVVQSNGGSYGGGIRIGTPDIADPALKDLQNDNIRIGFNRILANGGTNLAGAIGLFNGTENYEIDFNDICGNFSAEYGGGISHVGMSPGGSIHNNRIYFNRSYDEGGGIMIAGELPADFTQLSPGAGPVDIHANLIQANLGNDDGGGLRFLMAGNFTYNVYNNIIVNNVSTHEGGGISINDAPDVRVINNTIMKNLTTATAMTSNGQPAPAGLSTARNSALLQATLNPNALLYSNPVLFNNIFWDNRAGSRIGGGVSGIGLEGDPFPINYWDLGMADRYASLEPTYSILQVPSGSDDSTNMVGVDPLVVEEYDVSVSLFAWRGNPNFVDANIVTMELPVTLMGDYHIQETSPAVNAGTRQVRGIFAPNQDIDVDPRPYERFWDIGADEIAPPFPYTPQLFGTTFTTLNDEVRLSSSVKAESTQQLPYQIFAPIIGLTFGDRATWSGQLDSYDYDETTGTVMVLDDGALFWNKTGFGYNQEVYLTFDSVEDTATRHDLLLKVGGLGPDDTITDSTYLIAVRYNPATREVSVETLSPSMEWQTFITYRYVDFNAGDRFGARSAEGGIVEIYRNSDMIGRTDLSAGPHPWAYCAYSGFVGVWFEDATGVAFTDFGGGTIP